MGRARFAACIAVLAATWLAAQETVVGGIRLEPGPNDQVRVTRSDWAWSGGAEKHPASTFTLDSGRAVYAIRYNHRDSGGTLGISSPTRCNWYESGALSLFVDGTRYSFASDNGLTVRTAEGVRGLVEFAWTNATAAVTCRWVMPRGADRVYVELALQPRAPAKALRLDFSAYPSGFNRGQPAHLLRTPQRRVEAPGKHALDPATETAVFLADGALDPADGRGEGACALVLAPGAPTSLEVRLGGYGVGVSVGLAPETRRLRFCLIEFGARPNAEAWERLAGTLAATQASLADEGLFAPSAGQGR